MRMQKSRVLSWILLVALALVFVLRPYTEVLNRVYAVAVLLASILLVVRSRKNNLALIVSLFLAYSNYSIVMGVYLFPELRPEALYPQITDVRVYGIGIAMMLLFTLAVALLMPTDKKPFVFSRVFVREENYSILAFSAMTAMFVLIMLMGYGRVDSGRGTSSALYEYDVIIMIIMFYFCGNRKIPKAICCGCAGLYVLTSLLNGTRIEALACMIVVYLCFIRREIPLWLIVVGMVGGIVLFNIIGMFRGDYASLSVGLQTSIQSLKQSKLVFDTCTHAYFPALCMIEQFMDYSMLTAADSFVRFLGTIFLGQTRVAGGDLIMYVREMYYHNYGGVVLGFLYVWFSYFGSIFFGWIVTKLIGLTYSAKERSPLPMCAALYTAVMVPRWYLYGPWAITRGVLLCLVAMVLVCVVWRGMLRKPEGRIPTDE